MRDVPLDSCLVGRAPVPRRTPLPSGRAVRILVSWLWGCIGLGVGLAGCASDDPCAAAGVAELCSCPSGLQGARVCGADGYFGACDCSGAIRLAHALPKQATQATEEEAGAEGDDSQESRAGGSGAASGEAGDGTGAMAVDASAAPVGDASDTVADGELAMPGDSSLDGLEDGAVLAGDAGVAVVDRDGSVTPGPDAGDAPGQEDDAGEADDVARAAYGPCPNRTGCPTGTCLSPFGATDRNVCAATCDTVRDCPVPEGDYDAQVVCSQGLCALDCTPALFAAALSCPYAMECVADLLGPAFCFHRNP